MATWITDDMDIDTRTYPIPLSLMNAGIGINERGELTDVTTEKRLTRYKLDTRDELIWFVVNMPFELRFFDHKNLSLQVVRNDDDYVTRKISIGFLSKYVGVDIIRAEYWEGICVALDIIEKLSEFEYFED